MLQLKKKNKISVYYLVDAVYIKESGKLIVYSKEYGEISVVIDEAKEIIIKSFDVKDDYDEEGEEIWKF